MRKFPWKALTVPSLVLSTVFGLALLIWGCAADPVKEEKTDNPDVAVSLLFIHDGCKVYRFRDAGEFVYFVKCDGSIDAQTIVPEHLEGKVTKPERTVQTN